MILTIDIGGTYYKIAGMTEDGNILFKERKRAEKSSYEVFFRSLTEIFREYGSGAEGIAIAFPGLIDPLSGVCGFAGNYQFLDGVDLYKELGARTGVPVAAEHDGKSAALGELWKGSICGYKDAIFVGYGTGLAGAVIKDRKIHAGLNDAAGEMSYLISDIDPENHEIHLIYEKCSAVGLAESGAAALGIPAAEYSGEQLFLDAAAGNEKIRKVLHKFYLYNAQWLINMQVIYAPEVIAIGGGISAQPELIDGLRSAIAELQSWSPYPLYKPTLVRAGLGSDANLYGALYNYLQLRGTR